MDRQALRETLLDAVEQEIDERPEGLDDSVTIKGGLNLDSVDLLSVMMRVESKLDIRLDTKDFQTVVTVGDLLDVIHAKVSAKSTKKAA